MMPFGMIGEKAGLYNGTTDRDLLEMKLENVLRDPSAEPVYLPLEFLKAITDDFSTANELGRGGFGVVYGGTLRSGRLIAVKKLKDHMHLVEDHNQFQNEVTNLAGFTHENIVQLVGYCVESRGELMTLPNGKYVVAESKTILLCFEYLGNGSLDAYISDEALGLGWDWEKRYRIIEKICRGLHFLHQDCHVVHMDLKPQNILMGDDMVPKISDFGLSRLLSDESSKIYTNRVTGTNGYMAPEYILQGKISPKADMYSMGIIVIEIITGSRKNPRSFPHPKHSNENNISRNTVSLQKFTENELATWKKRLESSENDAPKLEIYIKQVKQLLDVALKCVDSEPGNRPDAWEILQLFNHTPERSLCDSNVSDQHVGDLLRVHPLQLQFSLVHHGTPRTADATTCSLHLTNNTDKHVAFRLLTKVPKEQFVGPLWGFVPPSCRYTLAVTLRNQQEPQPESEESFTIESTIGSDQGLGLRNRRPISLFEKGNDLIFTKAKEKGREVHQVNLTSVSSHTVEGSDIKPGIMIIPSTLQMMNVMSSSIDVHPTKPWIMRSSNSGNVSAIIWDYDIQDRVVFYGARKKQSSRRSDPDDCGSNGYSFSLVGIAKFIARKAWIVVGRHSGKIRVCSYMAMRKLNSLNSKGSKTYLFSEVVSFEAHKYRVTSLDVHPTRPYVLSSSSSDGYPSHAWTNTRDMIKLWDWEKGWECIWKSDMQGGANKVIFNPVDLNDFVSVSTGDNAKVWNICCPNFKSTVPGTKGASCFDFFVQDGKLYLILAHGTENKATIWDYHDMTCVETLRGHTAQIRTCCSHPELPILITGSSDGTVRVWNSSTFSLVGVLDCGLGPVQDVACFKGSKRLVVMHRDGMAIAEIDHKDLCT